LFLYGEVPLTIKVRTALRAWPVRPILIWVRQLITFPRSFVEYGF
jgi:hypothetical protein